MVEFNKEEVFDIAMSVALEMCLEDKNGETLLHNDTLISDSGKECRLFFDFESLCMRIEFKHQNGTSIVQSVDRNSLETLYSKKK